MNDEPPVPLDPSLLLTSRTAFLQYLGNRFHDVEEDVESEAHTLLNDPPKMKELIVEHLRHMWREVLEPEWNRVTPLLQACVDAFRQVDFGEMSNVEAAQRVIGQEPDEWWQRTLETAERVVFVPSAHVGPYLGKFFGDKVLYVLFGARQP